MYIRHCRTGHFSVAHSVVWDHCKLQLPITICIIAWMSQSESSLIKTYWYLHKMNAISWLLSKSRLLLGKSPQFDVEKPPCLLERRSCSKRETPAFAADVFQPLSPCRPRCLLHCTVQQTEEARKTGGYPHDDGCGRLSSSWQTPRDQATKPDGLKIWILGYLRAPPNFTSLIISLTIQWPLHEYTMFLDGSEYHFIIRCIIHPTLYISTEFIPRKLL